MSRCLFVSDLHGREDRYRKLFASIASQRPAAVFLGGDLLPSGLAAGPGGGVDQGDFVGDFLAVEFERLGQSLGERCPRVFVVLGNDDSRSQERAVLDLASRGVWEYVHERRVGFGAYDVYGYACIPPSPFLLKDWERYDVSRHVEPGCISPEQGHRSVPVPGREVRYATVEKDLAKLAGNRNLDRAIVLFHAPPYKTNLDRAALDGQMVDHAPLDVHVGSIAIRRFVELRQPLVTLHGHIHESARLTGSWFERIGRTFCFSAAHDGPELALVSFDPDDPASADRELI